MPSRGKSDRLLGQRRPPGGRLPDDRDLVTFEDGQWVATSRDIARFFALDHIVVWQHIKRLICDNARVEKTHFHRVEVVQDGPRRHFYTMNRSGFNLLARKPELARHDQWFLLADEEFARAERDAGEVVAPTRPVPAFVQPKDADDDVEGGKVKPGREMVTMRDGKVFANSVDVADFFGKRHPDTLRAIDNLIALEPDQALRNFAQGSYRLPETGNQEHRCFDMDR